MIQRLLTGTNRLTTWPWMWSSFQVWHTDPRGPWLVAIGERTIGLIASTVAGAALLLLGAGTVAIIRGVFRPRKSIPRVGPLADAEVDARPVA